MPSTSHDRRPQPEPPPQHPFRETVQVACVLVLVGAIVVRVIAPRTLPVACIVAGAALIIGRGGR